MAELDILNPLISEVVKGIEGKSILIHSDGVKCGKTTVGCQMPKPLYLRFEQGINAIAGVPYMALENWSDFKKVNRQLTNKKTVDKAKELYTTIIFDTLDVAIKWCSTYVCNKYGVERLKDGNRGYGLWQEYADEWFGEIQKLLNSGFGLYFISHSESRKITDGVTGEEYEMMVPKGDKRTVDLVVEAADIIGYVKPNGVDEEGNVVKSSCYFAQTKEYKAGTRFTYFPKVLKEFSAENLQKALEYAIEKEEQEKGTKAISFESNKEKEERKEWTHEEIVNAIKPYIESLFKDYPEEVNDIVAHNLGIDVKVTETTKKQIPQLEMVLFDLQELAEEKGVFI